MAIRFRHVIQRAASMARAGYRAVTVRLQVVLLQLTNLFSRRSALGTVEVCLSMTTFGRRTGYVHIAIESILKSRDKPQRFILWLDEAETLKAPPPPLRRLAARGVELCYTPNYGPHKKLYPFSLTSERHVMPAVTCDDDVLYARNWLRELVDAHRAYPQFINGFRARRMKLVDGSVTPYKDWDLCETNEASYLHVLTNTSGCIYPPSFIDAARDAGDAFLQSCPTADDLWLHHLSVESRIKTRQVRPVYWEFQAIPGTQASSLFDTNFVRGENDRVISRLYTAADIDFLQAEQQLTQ